MNAWKQLFHRASPIQKIITLQHRRSVQQPEEKRRLIGNEEHLRAIITLQDQLLEERRQRLAETQHQLHEKEHQLDEKRAELERTLMMSKQTLECKNEEIGRASCRERVLMPV